MSDRGGEIPDPSGGDRPQDIESRPVLADPRRILDTFERARPVTVSDTGAVAGLPVKVQGRAAPGPAGVLRAPLSGVECVWYRSLVFRELRESQGMHSPFHPLNPIALSDLPHYGADTHVGLSRQPLGSDRSSVAPFGITDGRRTLLVDPAVADIDSHLFGINAVVGHQHSVGVGPVRFAAGTFTGRELHAEWVIPVGAPLLAIGAAAHDAAGNVELVVRDPDVVLVSTKPEEQVLSRNRAAVDPTLLPPLLRNLRALKIGLYAFILVAAAVVALVVVLVVVP